MVEDSLPEELCIQILSRLPAECLVRFRCVCKTWFNLISSAPFFIDHLTHQSTDMNTNKYLVFNHDNFYSLRVVDESENTSLEINFRAELVVYGSCNGLVCLSHESVEMNSDIYLWNPVIRKIKKLPVPSLVFDVSPDMVDFGDDELVTSVYVCFGYEDDDYKVVMVGVVEGVCSVGIYSLGNNCWSVVDDFENDDDDLDPFRLHDLVSRDSRFVNGVAYFKTSDDADNDNVIVCFDMSRKVIREIGLPDEIHEIDSYTMDVYGEYLAVLTVSVYANGLGCLSISLLSDESVPSWEKILVIDLSWRMNINPRIPVRFISKGKVLIKVGVKLFVCNLETQKLGELKGEGMTHNIRDCLGESLALLGEDNVDVRAMSYQRR